MKETADKNAGYKMEKMMKGGKRERERDEH